jgi:hypothetical protein
MNSAMCCNERIANTGIDSWHAENATQTLTQSETATVNRKKKLLEALDCKMKVFPKYNTLMWLLPAPLHYACSAMHCRGKCSASSYSFLRHGQFGKNMVLAKELCRLKWYLSE